MVASPGIVPGDGKDPAVAQLAKLKQQLGALANKTLYSISVVSANGTTLLAIGPSGYVDGSGKPLNTLTINDPISGFPIIKQSPATVTPLPNGARQGSNFFWSMTDAAGNRLIATDGLAGVGLAFPYATIDMHPYWTGNLPAVPATNGTYMNVVASQVTAATLLWEGRIGYLSCPCISADGVWGNNGGSTAAVTYTLLVNGNTIGTWTYPANSGLTPARHTFQLSNTVPIGTTDATVQLKAQSSISTADTLYAHVLGCFLRQTPANGVFG